MAVGDVIINESVQISSKLDKVTTTQNVRKVYGLDIDGSNLLFDYPVALPTTSKTLPTFTLAYNLVTGNGISTLYNTSLIIPSTGVVLPSGNLRSDYTFTFPFTDASTWKRCSTNVEFGYSNYNGAATQCTVKYVADATYLGSSVEIIVESVTATISGGTIRFTPKVFNVSSRITDITVLEITF